MRSICMRKSEECHRSRETPKSRRYLPRQGRRSERLGPKSADRSGKKRLHALLTESVFQEEVLPAILNGDGTRPGPLYWLQECTETYDEHWVPKGLASPYAKFPQLPYWPWLFNCLMREREVLIPKSREMMISWAVVGYGVWHCQVFPRTRFIVQLIRSELFEENG